MPSEPIGRRIQATREARGITASGLARLVDVTPTAVWNWENNDIRPRNNTLSALAKVLGVTREFLLDGGDVRDAEGAPATSGTVAEIIENARAQIARASGFPAERVKLHLEFVTD